MRPHIHLKSQTCTLHVDNLNRVGMARMTTTANGGVRRIKRNLSIHFFPLILLLFLPASTCLERNSSIAIEGFDSRRLWQQMKFHDGSPSADSGQKIGKNFLLGFGSRREHTRRHQRKSRRYVDPKDFQFLNPKPADLQIECMPLRSKRFFTDGFCTSVDPVDDHVCTGRCLPIGDLPWYAEYVKVWSRTKTHDYRCVEDVVVRQKISFLCDDGRNRSYTIPVVESCKCKKSPRSAHNRTPSSSRFNKHRRLQRVNNKKYDKSSPVPTTTTAQLISPAMTTTTSSSLSSPSTLSSHPPTSSPPPSSPTTSPPSPPSSPPPSISATTPTEQQNTEDVLEATTMADDQV